MPELPELEHIHSRLEQDFTQRARLAVSLDTRCGPVVVRDLTGLVVPSQLTGRMFDDVIRRGTTLSETRARRRVANFCRPLPAGWSAARHGSAQLSVRRAVRGRIRAITTAPQSSEVPS